METPVRMKASVVIPVYNKAPYLKECLDSVLGQSFTDIEVIAIDDCSTDESLQILRNYQDPRLKVFSMPKNSGPGLAAQAAHDRASGEYIIRVDADDIQHPERFAKQIAFMDSDPTIGISGTAMQRLHNRSLMMPPLNDKTCRANAIFVVPVLQPTMILRRNVIVQHSIRYDPSWPYYGEDWLLMLLLFPHTRFANLDEVLVTYREGGISSTRSTLDMHVLFREAFKAFGLPEPTSEELDLHCMIVKHFKDPPNSGTIKDFRQWLEHLRTWNRTHSKFDRIAFENRLDQAWKELFYFLPPFGPDPVWAYLKAGGRLD
ncbi:MAG: glycosyltransferase, partial [Bacteroidota bacterium]|nr:glycosyltransferase [Bacteroidota bacterium]